MLQNEKRFRIATIIITTLVIGVFIFALYAPTNAIEFDPNHEYKNELNLPDTEPDALAVRVIQWALGFLGLISVGMIIFGGFMWMTSAGNEQRVEKGREIIKWAVIGLVVVMLSWAIVVFVFQSVENQALNTNPLSLLR